MFLQLVFSELEDLEHNAKKPLVVLKYTIKFYFSCWRVKVKIQTIRQETIKTRLNSFYKIIVAAVNWIFILFKMPSFRVVNTNRNVSVVSVFWHCDM